MSAVSQPVTHPQPQIAPPSPVPVQSPPKRRRWPWLIAALVLALVAYAIYRAKTSAPKQPVPVVAVRTAVVEVGNLVRTTRIAGQTSAINFANVTAPTLRGPEARDMVLMKVATPGSWVKKGTLIAQIDAQSLADHIDDLGDTIEAAMADVNKRRAEQSIELENLQQTLRVAKSDWDKAKLDYGASEVRTDVERQLLKLTLDEAEAKYKEQVNDLVQKKRSQEAELRVLDLTRERHVRHRDRHRNDLKAFTIYAAMDGLIVMQPIFRGNEMGQFQQGDRLFPGQPFMKVVNTKLMQLEGTVNQAESSDFRIGQQARVHLDAFPGLEFKGNVHSLGALAVGGWRQNYYIRTVPVRVRIENNDPKLIPDLSASADVILDRTENKPIVPLSGVREENGKTVAYVKNAESFEPREIALGLRNDTHAAVLSGLKAGDVVRLN